jgi:nitric oxide reductase subunit B
MARDGDVLFGPDAVARGQGAWRAAGGQQLGTVWGHGSYIAPDWSADWLHREAIALRDILARERHAKAYDALALDQRAVVDATVKRELRTNTYDPQTKTVRVSASRADAIREVSAHYEALFGDEPALDGLREQYAMTSGSLEDAAERKALSAFFFWTAWAAATDRPGEERLSYTSNWPH